MLDLVAGATAALVTTVAVISFASLVFSGRMAPFIAEGTTLALLSGVLLPLFGLGLYRAPALILIPNPVAPIVALVVAAAVAALPADAPHTVVYVNGLAALMLSTIVTGGFMYGLGRLRLVAFSRFLPYPILIGMFGAVGWLFIAGTPGILGLGSGGPAELWALSPARRAFALMAVGLAAALQLLPGLAPTRLRSAVVPSLLLLFFALFHAGRAALDLSLGDLADIGGLMRAPASGGSWLPLLGPGDLQLIEPRALLAAPWELMSLAALTAIKATLMLNGIEAQTKMRLSAERDMAWSGLGSLLVGPLGGYPGHVSISMSTIVQQLGGRTARVFVGYLAVAGLAFLAGPAMVAWLPVPMIAGVLMYLGLAMLNSALVTERRKMSRGEFAIVALLVLVQAAVGFLSALLVGLLAAIALFIFEYSRIETVRPGSAREQQSSVRRSPEQRLVLLDRGDRLQILELRGYLFFGTSERLVQIVEQALADGAPRVEHVLLDFRRVSGMDVSSAACFEKIAALAERRAVRLSLSALSPAIEAALRRVGVVGHPRVSVRADLDRALEEAEERLLQQQDDGAAPGERLLSELGVLAEVTLAAGERLFARGEALSRVYFLTRGRVSLEHEGRPAGLAEPGAVVGAGAQLGAIEAPYTAVALADCHLFALDGEALGRIDRDTPTVGRLLNQLIADHDAMLRDGELEPFGDLAADHAVERSVPAGTELIRQGEALDRMFIVVSGRLDVVLAGTSARVRAIGPGDVLGEVSYYAHSSATATVVARTVVVVRELDREALRRLEVERPAAAAAFHRRFAQVLAGRLARDTLVKSRND